MGLVSYANHLNKLVREPESSRLNEFVKKFIASRILGKNHHSASDIVIEQNLNTSLHDNTKKLIATLPEDDSSKRLSEFIDCSTHQPGPDLQKILDILKDVEYDGEVPDDILSNPFSETQVPNQLNSPAIPKGRGRPKKQIVLANTEHIAKEACRMRAKKVNLIFFGLIRQVMTNLAQYFGGTTGRILLTAKRLDDPEIKIKIEHSDDCAKPLIKKVKLDLKETKSSPLNSAESKSMDMSLIRNLVLASECWTFLNSSDVNLKKLLDKFIETSNASSSKWLRRFNMEALFTVPTNLDDLDKMKVIKRQFVELPTQDSVEEQMMELRSMVQFTSYNYSVGNHIGTFESIDALLSKMRQENLLLCDESYLNGDSIDEFTMQVLYGKDLNYELLFFDPLSILRYCIYILMDTLEQYILTESNISETALGHTITLSQFDWPKKASTYKQCIQWIRANKPTATTPQSLSDSTKFTYPEFFQYIKNPHIIEDFMALLCQGYTLDIKSNMTTTQSSQSSNSSSSTRGTSGGSSTRSGKAITTRGTNKSFREDLKVAIVGQMKISSFLMPFDLNARFIQNSLLPYLMQLKT